MAIKFEDKGSGKAPRAKSDATKEAIEARFATPIDASDPVNSDEASMLPFAKPVRPEKKGRRK